MASAIGNQPAKLLSVAMILSALLHISIIVYTATLKLTNTLPPKSSLKNKQRKTIKFTLQAPASKPVKNAPLTEPSHPPSLANMAKPQIDKLQIDKPSRANPSNNTRDQQKKILQTAEPEPKLQNRSSDMIRQFMENQPTYILENTATKDNKQNIFNPKLRNALNENKHLQIRAPSRSASLEEIPRGHESIYVKKKNGGCMEVEQNLKWGEEPIWWVVKCTHPKDKLELKIGAEK